MQALQCVDKGILQVLGSLSGHRAAWDMSEFGIGFRGQLGTHVHIPVAAHKNGHAAVLGTKYSDEGKQLLAGPNTIPAIISLEQRLTKSFVQVARLFSTFNSVERLQESRV